MSERTFLSHLRKTAVRVAAESIITLQDIKRVADEAEARQSKANGSARSPKPPSLSKISEFMGAVATLGLDQIDGVLKLRRDYWDDVVSWFTDQVLPKSTAKLPRPEVRVLAGKQGGKVMDRFVVVNDLCAAINLTFEPPRFRTADGIECITIPCTFSPPSIELQPAEPWSVTFDLTLAGDTAPGRYVGLIDAKLGADVAHRLLLDLTVEKAN